MASYFLTNEFTPVPSATLAPFETGESYKVTAGKITKEVKDFKTVTRQVIANLEGGYYNPAPGYNHPGSRDPRYSTSGETMFGIDRKAGGTINTGAAGKKFWKKIDEIQAKTKWTWNYIPPDPLQTELIDLVIQMQEEPFNRYLKIYVPDSKAQAVIKSDGRLLFNFVYATWNGPGWFQGWGKEISEAYKKGKTSSEDLLKLFVARRINNANVLNGGNKQNSLINQGGNKIKNLVGLQ